MPSDSEEEFDVTYQYPSADISDFIRVNHIFSIITTLSFLLHLANTCPFAELYSFAVSVSHLHDNNPPPPTMSNASDGDDAVPLSKNYIITGGYKDQRVVPSKKVYAPQTKGAGYRCVQPKNFDFH